MNFLNKIKYKMNFLNKMNFTCIVSIISIIIIAMATLYLYNIKYYENFEGITLEDNQIVNADVNILIPSMNQVVFNGKKLSTIINDTMPELSVISYAGSTAPNGWQLCDGNLLKYSDNSGSVDSGDTRTINFIEKDGYRLTPDLRGRFILGSGPGNQLTDRDIHTIGGDETHTLTIAEMPSHNHSKSYPIHNYPGSDRGGYRYAGTIQSWEDSQHTGGDDPHNNMPPYYVLTYIIKQPSQPS